MKESFSADGLSSDGQSAALIILEARPASQLFSENPDFLLEAFDKEVLVVIHQPGDAHQEKG